MTQISPLRYFGLMGRPSVDVNDQSCNVIPSESSVADLEAFVQLIRGSTIPQARASVYNYLETCAQDLSKCTFWIQNVVAMHIARLHDSQKARRFFQHFFGALIEWLDLKTRAGEGSKGQCGEAEQKITRMSFMHLYLLLSQWVMIIGVVTLCIDLF